MAQEGGGGWSRARPVSTAPTSPRPAPAVIGESATTFAPPCSLPHSALFTEALSPRSVSPQRQALGASAPPSTAQPSTAPDPQGAGSRISMGPKRALSPLRDRQFRASVQMEKSEAPPQPAPDLIQAVSTPAAREWLMSSAFGERVAVVRHSCICVVRYSRAAPSTSLSRRALTPTYKPKLCTHRRRWCSACCSSLPTRRWPTRRFGRAPLRSSRCC